MPLVVIEVICNNFFFLWERGVYTLLRLVFVVVVVDIVVVDVVECLVCFLEREDDEAALFKRSQTSPK